MIPLIKIPIEATWTEMERAVDDGLVRNIGVSNFSILKLSDLLSKGRIPPAVNQVEYHPYLHQTNLHKFCHEHQIHVTAYGPLGAGHGSLLNNIIIKSVASKLSLTSGQAFLAWAHAEHHSFVCTSSSVEHLKENLDIMSAKVSKSDMDQIRVLDCRQRFISGEMLCVEDSSYTYEQLWDEKRPET